MADQKQFIKDAKTLVRQNLPASNPDLSNSVISAITTGNGASWYLADKRLERAFNDSFIATASGPALDRHGECLQNPRIEAAAASGAVYITGDAGVVVGESVQMQAANGQLYRTTNTTQIITQSQAVVSLVNNNGLATITTVNPIFLATGNTITVSGADQAGYNGDFVVTKIAENKVTFAVDPSLGTPASGTINIEYTAAEILIAANNTGLSTNLFNGDKLTFTTPIFGVDSDVYVDLNGVNGGVDREIDDAYRDRLIADFSGVPAVFNAALVDRELRKISGITRVFPQSATPYAGGATVYFVKDNDANITPSTAELNEARAALVTGLNLGMLEEDLFVLTPTLVPVAFEFSSLSPNTPQMRQALTDNLNDFFLRVSSVGEDILETDYRTVISSTVDLNGNKINGFTLAAPVGDIAIGTGQLATFNGVIT